MGVQRTHTSEQELAMDRTKFSFASTYREQQVFAALQHVLDKLGQGYSRWLAKCNNAPFNTHKLTGGLYTVYQVDSSCRCSWWDYHSQNLSLSLSRGLPLLFSYRPAGGISAPCLPAGDLLRLEEPLQCPGCASHTWHCDILLQLANSQSASLSCQPLLTEVSIAHPYGGLRSGVGSVQGLVKVIKDVGPREM